MQETIRTLLVIATLAPLVSALIVVFLGKRIGPQRSGWFATLVMAGSFVCALVAMFCWFAGDRQTFVWNVPWLPVGFGEGDWLVLGALVDGLTIAMMVMVTGVAALVHLYSIGYMHGDRRYHWFFAYLSLFSFSMLGIVISNSLLQLFIFWELVGLTSYLLIGFWFEKRGPRLACTKAFVMNRIGDAGFLIGFGILFWQLGGNVLLPAAEGVTPLGESAAVSSMLGELTHASDHATHPGLAIDLAHAPLWLTVAGIGLFFGAVGKSAQFPLHTWLPDAMEGPTPVSSIVHSATMVAAGVYLTARIYPILTPKAHLFIASIGLITLVMAACMALVMTDIKRVLAYSTLSQLGYMVLGLGVGAWTFALYHLITHAFFKCCLFQCSGSVIHAAHHEQDMRAYGGLGRKMKWTMAAYAVCTLAIAGASIPFTAIGVSGFYSKDGIIAGSFAYGHALSALGWWANLFWIGPVVIAFVTPFYMARSFALTFLGKPRKQAIYDHAHEAPWTMVVPQVALATMAVISGSWFLWRGLIESAEPGALVLAAKALDHGHGMHLTHAVLLQGFAWILAIALGLWMYKDGFAISRRIARLPGVNLLYILFSRKFYFDALYDLVAVGVTRLVAAFLGLIDKSIVDGMVNGAGQWGKRIAMGSGWFDRSVVDGAADGAAELVQSAGRSLRVTQVGNIRGYIAMLFAAALVITAVVVAVVVVQ